MILTKDKILEEIKNENISIEPFDENNLGPASYDLTLAEPLRIFNDNDAPFPVKDGSNYKDITNQIKIKEYYELKPGEFILGITKEKIRLAGNIAGTLTGRSRFARLGISVHITASFVQPGVNNRQVLEIKNVSRKTFRLYSGTKLLQIIFMRCDGSAEYSGIFKEQLAP